MAIVEFENVTRLYRSGEHELRALDDVSFTLEAGKFVVILGITFPCTSPRNTSGNPRW